MEKLVLVEGENKGEIVLFALSTCVWCKKVKKLLGELGVEYKYVDFDLIPENEIEDAQTELISWNPRGSFPTIIINQNDCIVGFDEDKIREVLK